MGPSAPPSDRAVDEIPDSWPPEPQDAPFGRRALTAPLFPLPGAFLFPRQLMALHVFEPRYRQMVEDILDGAGRIVIGTIPENQRARMADLASPPEVLPVAGLGEIARHERLPDGRFAIWLFGLGRVAIEELPSERLYRQVRCAPLAEVEPTPAEARTLEEPLRGAVQERHPELLNLPDDVPTSMLVDLLCQRLPLAQPDMEAIFAEPDVARRAQLALDGHASAGPAPEGD